MPAQVSESALFDSKEDEAKDELENLLSHPDLRNVPLLFFANKMDRPMAKQPVECVSALGLQEITDKPWHIGAHTHPDRSLT